MLLDVNTRELEIQVTEDEIDVRIEYELDVNHEPMADCRIKMNIMSRSNGSFSRVRMSEWHGKDKDR